jgi:hypothetical protein
MEENMQFACSKLVISKNNKFYSIGSCDDEEKK